METKFIRYSEISCTVLHSILYTQILKKYFFIENKILFLSVEYQSFEVGDFITCLWQNRT